MVAVAKSRSIIVGSTAVAVTGLSPTRLYVIYHSGVAADETTASTGRLHVDFVGGTAVTTVGVGDGIHSIPSGASWPVPPGTTAFSIIAPSDTLVDVIGSEVSLDLVQAVQG